MEDRDRYKKGLEIIEDLVSVGAIKEVEDSDQRLNECSMAVCMKYTPENVENIPDMWKDQIDYGKCSVCDTKVFFRTNMPKDVPLACYDCAMDVIAQEDDPQIVTRKSGTDEIKEYLKRKGTN